jgi:hypothetical protein
MRTFVDFWTNVTPPISILFKGGLLVDDPLIALLVVL